VVLKGFQYIIQRSLQAILKTGLLSSRFTNNKNVTILHGWMTLRPRSSLLARSLFRWYHLSSLILSSFLLQAQTITINYTKCIKNANAFMAASSSSLSIHAGRSYLRDWLSQFQAYIPFVCIFSGTPSVSLICGFP